MKRKPIRHVLEKVMLIHSIKPSTTPPVSHTAFQFEEKKKKKKMIMIENFIILESVSEFVSDSRCLFFLIKFV